MYQMNEQTVDILDRVRGKLEVDLWEGDGAEDDVRTEYKIGEGTVTLLDQVRRKLEIDLHEIVGGTNAGDAASAGVGGAINPTDVADAFDLYLDNIMDSIITTSGKSDNAAEKFIVRLADKLAASGDLPPWPSEGSDDEASIWLGKAKTIGFHRRAVKASQG